MTPSLSSCWKNLMVLAVVGCCWCTLNYLKKPINPPTFTAITMATNKNNAGKGNSSFNDPESNMSPSVFIHQSGDELHVRVEMFLSSRHLGVGISFQVQRGEERGRRSCYQSAAPGPKTDRTETSVQDSQTLTKDKLPSETLNRSGFFLC